MGAGVALEAAMGVRGAALRDSRAVVCCCTANQALRIDSHVCVARADHCIIVKSGVLRVVVAAMRCVGHQRAGQGRAGAVGSGEGLSAVMQWQGPCVAQVARRHCGGCDALQCDMCWLAPLEAGAYCQGVMCQ